MCQVLGKTLQMFTPLILKLIIWAEKQNKKFKSHTQIHTARKWQSWGLNPGNSAAALNTYIPKSSKVIVFVCFFKAGAPSQQLLSSSCLPFLCTIFPGAYHHSHSPGVHKHSITPLCFGTIKPRHKGVTLGAEMLLCPKRKSQEFVRLIHPRASSGKEPAGTQSLCLFQSPGPCCHQSRPSTCPNSEVHPHSCHPSKTCFPTPDWLKTPWTPAQPRERAENTRQRGFSDVIFDRWELIRNAKTFAQTADSKR